MRATKHPGEAILALHAGGDLGPIARWRVERHLRQCETCQEEILAFEEMRQMVSELSDMPDVPWDRLAGEMQANIRLGLVAGECVRETVSTPSFWSGLWNVRAATAAACLAVLIGAGWLVERPRLPVSPGIPNVSSQTVLGGTSDGVQMSRGNETLALKHDTGLTNVSYSATTGSLGDTYIDPLTGDVTVNKVAW